MRALDVSFGGEAPIATFGFDEPGSVDAKWALASSVMGFSTAAVLVAGKLTVATAVAASAGSFIGVMGALAWLAARKDIRRGG